MTIAQSGAGVVATASGTLVTTGLPGGSSGPSVAMLEYVSATDYAYLLGATGIGVATYHSPTFVTAQPLHATALARTADSSTGGAVGVDGVGGPSPILVVPNGYVSGTPISATATWTNTTLAGLSLVPGAYVFSYGADSITFNVVAPQPPAAEAIPTTSAWVTGALSLALLLVAARRSGRRSA